MLKGCVFFKRCQKYCVFSKSSMLEYCVFSKNYLNNYVFSYVMRWVYVSVIGYVVSFFAVIKENFNKLWLF